MNRDGQRQWRKGPEGILSRLRGAAAKRPYFTRNRSLAVRLELYYQTRLQGFTRGLLYGGFCVVVFRS